MTTVYRGSVNSCVTTEGEDQRSVRETTLMEAWAAAQEKRWTVKAEVVELRNDLTTRIFRYVVEPDGTVRVMGRTRSRR